MGLNRPSLTFFVNKVYASRTEGQDSYLRKQGVLKRIDIFYHWTSRVGEKTLVRYLTHMRLFHQFSKK
jgi:hypothetical protein